MIKKKHYETLSSPVKIDINQGHANILEDWKRLRWGEASINGVLLSAHMKKLNIEQGDYSTIPEERHLTEVKLKNFFSDVILSEYSRDNSFRKEQAIASLLKTFHQGGLLHPVSAGMSSVFENQPIAPSATNSPKQVNIQTNANGFVIQEIYTVNEFKTTINASKELSERYNDGIISPDPGNLFVLQAQATIGVSFDNEGSLRTEVINQAISYGNEYVKNIADQRHWFSKLVDAIKSLFGFNTVEDLSPDQTTHRPVI